MQRRTALELLFRSPSCTPGLAGIGLLLALLSLPAAGFVQDSTLTLPQIHLIVSPVVLQQLEDSIDTNREFPAAVSYEGQTYPCSIRYRGTFSRHLPKKSWHIELRDADNAFGRRVLSLRAEYRDLSLLRNHLVLRLMGFMGMPVSDSRFVSLQVNGQFYGVMQDVEHVDADWLRHRNLPDGPIFEPLDHGATMAPQLGRASRKRTWKAHNDRPGEEAGLHDLLARLAYWRRDEFEAGIPSVVDVENVLTYFAVTFAVSNIDGMTKNFYVYVPRASGAYRLIPWDNDASLGNHYTGRYETAYETWAGHGAIEYALLLQRLLEIPRWNDRFHALLREIADDGFAFLVSELDSMHAAIRHDVILDPSKRATNEQFDAQPEEIKTFLSRRSEWLRAMSPYARIVAEEAYVTDPFPTPNGSTTFRIRLEQPADNVRVEYVPDLDPEALFFPYSLERLALFDDGLHDDLLPGDLVYGNTLTLPDGVAPWIPYTFGVGRNFYPPQGLWGINRSPAEVRGLNTSGVSLEAAGALRFGPLVEAGGVQGIDLINPGEVAVDLSGLVVALGSTYRRLTLPPGIVLAAGDSLRLVSDETAARAFDPDRPIVGDLFFRLQPGDTLRLLSPGGPSISETALTSPCSADAWPTGVVINEIQPGATAVPSSDDWIELSNASATTIDLSGWVLQDDNPSHVFRFEQGTVLPPFGYVVVARDAAAFRFAYPMAEPVAGDLGFGLARDRDAVRLFVPCGLLVDEVVYDTTLDWPADPDAAGRTLELIDPGVDNGFASAWRLSLNLGGTPGRENSTVRTANETDSGAPSLLLDVFPIPARSIATVQFRLPRPGRATIAAYDAMGRQVATLFEAAMDGSAHRLTWDVGALAAGVYHLVLKWDGAALRSRTVVVTP